VSATLRTADGRLRAPVRLFVGSLAIVVTTAVVAVTLVSLLASAFGSVGTGVQVVAGGVGTTLAVLFVARELDRRTLADLGLNLDRRWWVELGVGLALGALLLTGVFVVLVAGGWARVTRVAVPALVPWLGTLGLFVVVGFYEELFVRGWLLTNVAEAFESLGERAASAVGVVASAGVFGVLHVANPSATLASTLGITAAGVFLGVAFVRTASLAVPVGVHVTWNFVQGSVYGFPVSGLGTPATLVATTRAGPELVTGGPFGPEASVLGLGASLAGTLAVLGYARANRAVPDWSEALAWTTTPALLDRGERTDGWASDAEDAGSADDAADGGADHERSDDGS
jgi:hypothetical protein